MIDSKNLSELLTCNVHPQLYPRIFVMSSNGNLIAYSTPADMLQMRDQAALISMAWRENFETLTSGSHVHANGARSNQSTLRALTVEFSSYNVIARAIQPNLILAIIGGVFPGKRNSFKLTTETFEDAVYPGAGEVDLTGGSDGITTLQLQRRKADKLVDFIETGAKLLHMPEDNQLSKPFS